jgi:hypothetical protein
LSCCLKPLQLFRLVKQSVSQIDVASLHYPACAPFPPQAIGTNDDSETRKRKIAMLTKLLARFGFGQKDIIDERFESRMMTMGRRNAQALPGAGRSAFRFQH